ncbi:hypothetical protein AYI68_g4390 [Smittium mucronatum]|uniref:Uncharacterized protein n=1 Tax=Smittium mucronatum TaxID=133383 RepID=A0A1R0GX73_9FUNG|nr:hypothetical protein AYI68_g4390 [Smittium mucronatum]
MDEDSENFNENKRKSLNKRVSFAPNAFVKYIQKPSSSNISESSSAKKAKRNSLLPNDPTSQSQNENFTDLSSINELDYDSHLQKKISSHGENSSIIKDSYLSSESFDSKFNHSRSFEEEVKFRSEDSSGFSIGSDSNISFNVEEPLILTNSKISTEINCSDSDIDSDVDVDEYDVTQSIDMDLTGVVNNSSFSLEPVENPHSIQIESTKFNKINSNPVQENFRFSNSSEIPDSTSHHSFNLSLMHDVNSEDEENGHVIPEFSLLNEILNFGKIQENDSSTEGKIVPSSSSQPLLSKDFLSESKEKEKGEEEEDDDDYDEDETEQVDMTLSFTVDKDLAILRNSAEDHSVSDSSKNFENDLHNFKNDFSEKSPIKDQNNLQPMKSISFSNASTDIITPNTLDYSFNEKAENISTSPKTHFSSNLSWENLCHLIHFEGFSILKDLSFPLLKDLSTPSSDSISSQIVLNPSYYFNFICKPQLEYYKSRSLYMDQEISLLNSSWKKKSENFYLDTPISVSNLLENNGSFSEKNTTSLGNFFEAEFDGCSSAIQADEDIHFLAVSDQLNNSLIEICKDSQTLKEINSSLNSEILSKKSMLLEKNNVLNQTSNSPSSEK